MKNKIKKWHIALMSFMALFVAVFASMFSLRADTVDEETGEVLMDNWELSTVFYDSSVDGGKTPLTEINWDASDGGYGEGEPRIITVQINYKNTSAVTTYQPGELEINIPNLAYGYEKWNSNKREYYAFLTIDPNVTIVVGANDSTHTGYDWNFTTASTPSSSQENFTFTNAKTIEEKTNFEGSIQIVYTITPTAEEFTSSINSKPYIEYTDECTHVYFKTLQASLAPQGIKIITEATMNNIESTINSPNWPKNYNNNMSQNTNYWEYTSDSLENLIVYFDKTSALENKYDKIYIYDKTGTCLYTLTGTEMAGKTFEINGNYVKIAMSSDSSSTRKGFSASIGNDIETTTIIPDGMILSNELEFNYTRTYYHPWEKQIRTIIKTAKKINSFDGLIENADNYIWVKYYFHYEPWKTTSYPYLYPTNLVVKDDIPSNCIVLDSSGNIMQSNNGTYSLTGIKSGQGSELHRLHMYVGYPKSDYNDTNKNLNITNTAQLYGTYPNDLEQVFLDDDTVAINLANFEFVYSGDLYGISKQIDPFKLEGIRYQDIIKNGTYNKASWALYPTAIYTGKPLTVKIGDDLLYVPNSDNQYIKLEDDEYYFSEVAIKSLKNGNGKIITNGKYDCELWVRYANSVEYVLYEEFTNGNGGVISEYYPNGNGIWKFTEKDHIVGFYFIIKDLTESLVPNSNHENYVQGTTVIRKLDIAENGEIHNFGYIQVYQKNESGLLVLQNEPDLSNYSNLMTQLSIATFDQETYGTYMQRATAFDSWSYYKVTQPQANFYAYKHANEITQDVENELFNGSFIIGVSKDASKTDSIEPLYFNDYSLEYAITGFQLYDLLPLGMELISSKEEIISSFDIDNLKDNSEMSHFYDLSGQQVSNEELINIIKNNTSVTITENWNNTGRTKIQIIVKFIEQPVYIFNPENYDYYTSISLFYKYNYTISYDAFLEYGNVYTNYCYIEKNSNDKYVNLLTTTTDNGQYDLDASDINENQNITDEFSYAYDTATIISAVSTHQDVITYVKTDQSNYSTGIVDSSCASEYEYKLRVRTGAADVTNLVIYTSIEEAQPNRSRWYGEFLGVDTTYAENKGYTVKVWYSPNKTVGTLAEDTSWQVYDEATVDKSRVKSLAFQYLVETDDTTGTSADVIDSAVLPANSLTYVLIKMKSPNDESETRLARMDCWTQWNALDDYDRPVDFITGINSNVVKVALPNSVKTDDMPSISLKFIKEIQSEISDFENLKLNKADEHIFMIRLTSLTANDDGTYNQVTGLLSSTQGLVITQIPIGTYLLEELGDNYFDFVEFTNNNDPEITIEGVTFEKTDQGYIITVSEDLSETVEFNIKVTNKTEDKRFYEEKHNKENLFLINKTGIDHNVPEE